MINNFPDSEREEPSFMLENIRLLEEIWLKWSPKSVCLDVFYLNRLKEMVLKSLRDHDNVPVDSQYIEYLIEGYLPEIFALKAREIRPVVRPLVVGVVSDPSSLVDWKSRAAGAHLEKD